MEVAAESSTKEHSQQPSFWFWSRPEGHVTGPLLKWSTAARWRNHQRRNGAGFGMAGENSQVRQNGEIIGGSAIRRARGELIGSRPVWPSPTAKPSTQGLEVGAWGVSIARLTAGEVAGLGEAECGGVGGSPKLVRESRSAGVSVGL